MPAVRAGPAGTENCATLWDLRIFIDQAAEPIRRRIRTFAFKAAGCVSSLTKTGRGRGRNRPGQRVPDIEVLTAGGPAGSSPSCAAARLAARPDEDRRVRRPSASAHEPGGAQQPSAPGHLHPRDARSPRTSCLVRRSILRLSSDATSLPQDQRQNGSARVLPRQSPSLTITHRDGSCGPGLDVVERLVGRALAVSLCNVCFPDMHAWHLRR